MRGALRSTQSSKPTPDNSGKLVKSRCNIRQSRIYTHYSSTTMTFQCISVDSPWISPAVYEALPPTLADKKKDDAYQASVLLGPGRSKSQFLKIIGNHVVSAILACGIYSKILQGFNTARELGVIFLIEWDIRKHGSSTTAFVIFLGMFRCCK